MKKFIQMLFIACLGGFASLSFHSYLTAPEDGAERLISQRTPVNFVNNSSRQLANAPDLTAAAESSVNGVVHVKTVVEGRRAGTYSDPFYEFFFGNPHRNLPPQKATASGSGVIISEDGYIVTNNHVIQNAEQVQVVLNDKREFEAEIIGRDPSTDLAVLKVKAKSLPFVYYGNSDEVRVGEWALAVGNPFSLTSTVTAGIISAKGRNINILNEKFAIESFLQTDAAVNPGNSGGALVNAQGELIGINSAIASNTGSYAGYAFAVPVNIVKKVVADLLEFGEVQRAFIGVVIEDVNADLVKKRNIDVNEGVYISGLNAGGAAQDAGIKEGDVITSIGEIPIRSVPELQEQVGRYRPGDKISVGLIRNGKPTTISVILKNKNGDTRLIRHSEAVAYELGAEFSPLTERELANLKITNGIRVNSIQEGKLKRIGIREGFIITHIGDKAVSNVDDIINSIKSERKGLLIEGIYPNGAKAYYGLGI